MSAETIHEEFDSLTLAQVYGVLAHYLENQASVDAYRVRQQRRFEAIRNAAEPLPEASAPAPDSRPIATFAVPFALA